MGTIANYILNGPTLETSTGLTTSAGGSAPDGFYSDGVTVRQLQNGVFVTSKVACDCTTACSTSPIIRGSGAQSVDVYTFSLGSNSGVSRIRFSPGNTPDGIKITEGTSSNTPKWAGTVTPYIYAVPGNPIDPIFLGNSANNFFPPYSFSNIPEQTFFGGTYTSTGNDFDITVPTANVKLSASTNPGELVSIISATANTELTIEAFRLDPSNLSGYTLRVECPYVIPDTYRFLSSSVQASPWACGGTPFFPDANYLVSIRTPQVAQIQAGDYLFLDNLGTSFMADGYYLIQGPGTSTQEYTVQLESGIVVSSFACP